MTLSYTIRRHCPVEEMASAEQMARALGILRQEVLFRRRKGWLLSFISTRGTIRFPEWQVVDGEMLNGLPELLDRFHGMMGFLYENLTRAWPELGGLTGVEALKSGREDEFRALIEAAYERQFAGTLDETDWRESGGSYR